MQCVIEKASKSRLGLMRLEDRDNPSTGLFAVAADTPGGPRVTVYNPNGTVRYDFLAYPSNLYSGVRVATGDVTGDGVEDIITAPGAGGGPDVRVWNGASAGTTPTLAYNFLAFGANDQRGVYLAVGDVNKDGRNDIVASGLLGSTPVVRVFSGINNVTLRQTQLPGSGFNDPYTVAAGDVNQDGYADVVVGSPYSVSTTDDVLAYNGSNGGLFKTFVFQGPPPNVQNINTTTPVFVAVGQLNGYGGSEIIFSGNLATAPSSGLPGAPNLQPAGIFVYDPNANVVVQLNNPFGSFAGQVRVATGDVNGDGRDDVIFGAGPQGGPRVTVRDYLNQNTVYQDFLAFGGNFYGGLYVG